MGGRFIDFPSGSINEIKLYSSALGEEITLLVYLPAIFSPLSKYTVLIAQDGRDYFQLGRIGRVADELQAKKEMESLIIIGVPYQSVKDRWQKYHPNGEKHQAYIRFMTHELVPFIDREYPTFQIGMGRALIGDSLAATVSLVAALEHPNTFGRLILQSPYINEQVLEKARVFKETGLLNIYHAVGNHETKVKTTDNKEKDFLTTNRALSHVFKEKRFDYFYNEFEGGHVWTHWQPDVKKALRKMFSTS